MSRSTPGPPTCLEVHRLPCQRTRGRAVGERPGSVGPRETPRRCPHARQLSTAGGRAGHGTTRPRRLTTWTWPRRSGRHGGRLGSPSGSSRGTCRSPPPRSAATSRAHTCRRCRCSTGCSPGAARTCGWWWSTASTTTRRSSRDGRGCRCRCAPGERSTCARRSWSGSSRWAAASRSAGRGRPSCTGSRPSRRPAGFCSRTTPTCSCAWRARSCAARCRGAARTGTTARCRCGRRPSHSTRSRSGASETSARSAPRC